MTKQQGTEALFLSGFGRVFFVWYAPADTVRVTFEGFVLAGAKDFLPHIAFAHSGQCLNHGMTWVRSLDEGRKIWAELRDKGWKVAGEL
jgi:hypothetical protein